MATVVKISFSKIFFASYLCVPESHIRYVLVKYEDEESTFYVPALRVRNINRWFFNIEAAEFMAVNGHISLLEAKTVRPGKDTVVFRSADGHEEAVALAGFYRRYMTRIANTLLYD